jgi:probable HAF family extracellular repeat protein
VVGTARDFNNISRAFIWRNGSMTDLGTIGGLSHSPASINNYAQVVGISTIAPGQTTAFLWEDSIMTDLNSLIDSSSGWILRSANDINNLGQIVGWGTHNGNARAFLLTPIKYPVFIVPGIAGTYASNMLFDLSWLIQRGLPPNQYQADPLGRVYDDLIKTFENIGYERDKNLFVVNYDWRLTPGPIDNNIDGHIDGLSGASITNNQFNYGVDYFGWYMKKACEKWREDYDTELDSIDVIAHSTGGLVTRTYIQSNAYGDEYDSFNNYRLPKIRNFVMIGVPNRGASKAWNPTHDNWIADKVYRFVLSKILNRAYQKVLLGVTITGPDHNISLSSIEDSLGNPDPKLFIKQYVPTIRYLLATYNFINFGSGVTHVNNDTDRRNTIVLDLNNGYDLIPNSNPNDFLDSTKATVIYGTGESTKVLVLQRNDFGNNVVQSFTDWFPQNVPAGTKWFEDLSTTNNGDGTVPIISSANQFMGDSRANLIPFSTSDHTGLVSKQEVQSTILDLLKIPFENKDISTGSAANILNVLNVISDPVELFITDGIGRRLGYSNTTGPVTEIPNSIWTGDTDGMGYVFGSLLEPITLQLTGLGENYYVMVSIEDSGNYGGIVLEGFLALGEQQTYNITLNPLSVNESPFEIPGSYALAQNYPNPFNPTTTISYSIPQSGNVKLVVYDMLGNEVATLVNKEQAPGVYSVLFDATNLASGVYFYRIKAGSFNEVKKMILMR